MPDFDYVIVGAGLFGAVFAYKAVEKAKKCLVIDRRSHAGGNVYCKNENGINVHLYGAHIFHTNDRGIWDFVNRFAEFNRYTNSPLANYKGKIYNLPFNMNTFYQIWGTISPEQAKKKIEEQIKELGISEPKNLEEQALLMVGPDIYYTLIKEYTEKQWGRKAADLPASIIKRLPLRFTYDNNYFNDKYQGIPIGGYNKIIEGLLSGVELRLNTDFFEQESYFRSLARTIVYTGAIDQFYHYRFGPLEYRGLSFEHQIIEKENYQGNAVVNYTSAEVPFTRIIEHKHFEFGTQPFTVISKEFPHECKKNDEPYYPVNNEENNRRYREYAALSLTETNVIFGGRLAEYKYYDMHQVIASALKKAEMVLTDF